MRGVPTPRDRRLAGAVEAYFKVLVATIAVAMFIRGYYVNQDVGSFLHDDLGFSGVGINFLCALTYYYGRLIVPIAIALKSVAWYRWARSGEKP